MHRYKCTINHYKEQIMIKHIVLFKLKETISAETKAEVAAQFNKAIEALPPVIKTIRNIRIAQNINAEEKWDICLDSDFDSLEDVKAYAIHPAHLAAASILKEYKQDRACVDYEY